MVPNLNRCHLHSIFEYIVTKCSLNIDKWTRKFTSSLSTMTTFHVVKLLGWHPEPWNKSRGTQWRINPDITMYAQVWFNIAYSYGRVHQKRLRTLCQVLSWFQQGANKNKISAKQKVNHLLVYISGWISQGERFSQSVVRQTYKQGGQVWWVACLWWGREQVKNHQAQLLLLPASANI